MTSRAKRAVEAVSVRGIEKRYQPTRCYKFVLEVKWSDSSRHVVYRSYSEFLDLHMLLMEAFPIEAGEIDPNDRVLPKLSGSSLFSRGEVQKVAEKRRTEISDYCNRLMTLQTKICQFKKLIEFLDLRDDDLNIPRSCKVKKPTAFQSFGKKLKKNKKGKQQPPDNNELAITCPLQLQSYKAVLDYKAAGKGQINLKTGDVVEVIDKNQNGWWYVSCEGLEGWAPATYLDKMSSSPSDVDEELCLAGEMFLTVKAYKANMADELSFDAHVVIEVLNKVLDGWWVASYNEKVGYVPSTYLKPYSNPYLGAKTNSDGSPIMPTPRRKSVLGSSEPARDLQPYRRATQKRRQRTIKHQKSAKNDETDLPINLSCIMELDSDYLEPQNTSSYSSSYIDPIGQPSSSPVDSVTVKLASAPNSEPNTAVPSRALNQRVRPDVSKHVDSDGYEPVNAYDECAVNGDTPPSYHAPLKPNVQPRTKRSPTPSPRTSRIPKVSSEESVDECNEGYDSAYETVCSGRKTSSLPPPLRTAVAPPKNSTLGGKLPPPKPDDSQLTRLSLVGDEYAYSPVNGKGDNLPTEASVPKVQPRVSRIAPSKSPRLGRGERLPQPSEPLGDVLSTRVKVAEVDANANNNNNGALDGKIYEELLIKPSQLKGQKNANVRRPK